MGQGKTDHIVIFDTTLRDGEQSPGINLNGEEKLEIARHLAQLNVDVIEAGFPIASPGDFEAVQAIAKEVRGPDHRGAGPGRRAGHRPGGGGGGACGEASHPHLHRHLATFT